MRGECLVGRSGRVTRQTDTMATTLIDDPVEESCNTRDRRDPCSVVPVETLRAAQDAVLWIEHYIEIDETNDAGFRSSLPDLRNCHPVKLFLVASPPYLP